MATRGPAPVDTGATPVVIRPVDRAPAPVPPGPGATGQIPTVKKPAGPPEAAAPAVTPSPGITVPPTPEPQGPPETAPNTVVPGPGTGQSTSANVTPTVPVQELPVDTPNVDAGNNVIPNISYIQVLANGTVVVSRTTALNFAGSGVTVTGSNGAATITISGSSYGNSNVVTLLSAFGSNTVSTTGNVTGGNVLAGGIISATGNIFGGNAVFTGNLSVAGNVTYINSNVVTINDLAINLANNAANISLINGGGIELGPQGTPYVTFLYNTSANAFTSNVGLSAVANITGGNLLTAGLVSATGNITGGNLITSAAISAASVSASGNITGGNLNAAGLSLSSNVVSALNVTGAIAGANVTTPGLISATGNVTGGNVLTGGVISSTGNITGGNINAAGNVSGNTAGFAIGYRDIPQVSFTANATIATTDAGKHYYSTLSTANVLTIANNASQGFQTGAAISIVNQGTGNITIAQGSGVTLYLAGNATSGNRILTTFGMATIMKVATDTWFINGTGVS